MPPDGFVAGSKDEVQRLYKLLTRRVANRALW
jgi:hypothetical protein